jgi:hypothetical protein
VTARATAAQRAAIERLVREDGRFDTRTVTAMHRLLGAPEALQGRPASEWLSSLDVAEASRIITKLRDEE